jgi:hypothetical protein
LAEIEFGDLEMPPETDDLVSDFFLKSLQNLHRDDHHPKTDGDAGNGDLMDHAREGLLSRAAHPF